LAGNYNGAVIDCTKALKLNPDFGAGYIERGRAKHKTENFVGAIKDFSKAIEMFPEFALPYGLRGDAKIKTGDIEGAIEDFKKLKQLDPRSEVAKHALKNISKMQKQNNENLTTVVSERNQKRDSLLGVIKNLIKK